MNLIQMKAIRIFKAAMIAVVALASITSCSSDDEQENEISTYPANAKGVCVYWGDNFIDTDESYYLWINDYIVKYIAREENIDITQRAENYINNTACKFDNKLMEEYFKQYLTNFFHYTNFNQWIIKG